MDDLEVREMRYFVAVAEELNYTRAARRLGIAQPPLSRTIRQIESRLGVTLLERDTHRVTLTDAGATLLHEARAALRAVSAATRRTRRAGAPRPVLTVTAKPGMASGLLSRIVAAYQRLPDTPEVDIVVSGYSRQPELIRAGQADLGLISRPYDDAALDLEELVTEPRVAVLPAGHELTRRDELRCRDLVGLPIPQWPDSTPAEVAYWAGQDVDLSGAPLAEPPREPRVTGPRVSDVTQTLEVVRLGQAVALLPRSVAEDNARPGVVHRPVRDATPYAVALAWPAGARSRSIALFVRTAAELAATERDTSPEPARSVATSP